MTNMYEANIIFLWLVQDMYASFWFVQDSKAIKKKKIADIFDNSYLLFQRFIPPNTNFDKVIVSKMSPYFVKKIKKIDYDTIHFNSFKFVS